MNRKTILIVASCIIGLSVIMWMIKEMIKRQLQSILPLKEMEDRFDKIMIQQDEFTDVLMKKISISKDNINIDL